MVTLPAIRRISEKDRVWDGCCSRLTIISHRHVRDDLFQSDLLLGIRLVLPVGLLELDLELLHLSPSCNDRGCGQRTSISGRNEQKGLWLTEEFCVGHVIEGLLPELA